MYTRTRTLTRIIHPVTPRVGTREVRHACLYVRYLHLFRLSFHFVVFIDRFGQVEIRDVGQTVMNFHFLSISPSVSLSFSLSPSLSLSLPLSLSLSPPSRSPFS